MTPHSTDEWTTEFRARGLPCGRVNNIAQAIEFATELGLNPLVSHDGITTLASPLLPHDTPVQYHRAPPSLGADSVALREWLSDSPHG
ncbi:hypothetical protein GCM10029964_052070 [Kibdelosporangium lantanae]